MTNRLYLKTKKLLDHLSAEGFSAEDYLELECLADGVRAQIKHYVDNLDNVHIIENWKSMREDSVAKRICQAENCRVLRSTENGNCLYNSVSILLAGNEIATLVDLLRLGVTLELVRNSSYYAKHPYIFREKSSDETLLFGLSLPFSITNTVENSRESMILKEGVRNLQPNKYSCLLDVIALSTVIERNIRNLYPDKQDSIYKKLIEGIIKPRIDFCYKDITIMWSQSSPDVSKSFCPDHFVPVVDAAIFKLDENNPTPPKKQKVESNEEKGISKINMPKKKTKKEPVRSNSILQFLPKIEKSRTDNELGKSSTFKEEFKPMPNAPSPVCKRESSSTLQEHDISQYLNIIHSMPSVEKVDLWKKVWRPSNNFKFPKSTNEPTRRTASCQFQWFEKYKWLVYSPSLDSLFCFKCLSMKKSQNSQLASVEGLRFWPSASTKLKNHDKVDCHSDFDNMVLTVTHPEKSIDIVANRMMSDTIRRNRNLIIPIIACIDVLGKRNISLRGHRDDSKYYLSDENDSQAGNFQHILKLVLQFATPELQKLLQSAPKNANYRSKTIHNQIIDVFADHILDKITQDIKKKKYFSVLADEATDCTNMAQMSICLRYLHNEKVEEKIFGFVHCKNGTTGLELSKLIEEKVQKMNLDFKDVRGQGYDGAGAVAGVVKGVAARLTEKYPHAPYVHCFSHRLNLCVIKVTKINAVRDMFEHSRCITAFFDNSPKRQNFFRKIILELKEFQFSEEKKFKLVDFSQTRWVQRIDGIERFIQAYGPLFITLSRIANSTSNEEDFFEGTAWDANTRTLAAGLRARMASFTFLFSAIAINEIFAYVDAITKSLQASSITIMEAYRSVTNVIESMDQVRAKVDEYNAAWFQKASSLASKLEIEIKIPRISKKQIHRTNVETNDEESHFRVNITLPCLNEVIEEMRRRFNPQAMEAVKGLYCIPALMKKHSDWKVHLKSFMEHYINDMVDESTCDAEINQWGNLWSSNVSNPDTIEDVLKIMLASTYPNIYRVLTLMAVLPVTTCSCERSISTLRRVKSYLRSTMTQDCLNGLCLLRVHNEMKIDYEQIIDRLAIKYPKRLQMINMLDDD